MKHLIGYEKYRWFFTSSGKLVVGGKSALQNDELLRKLKNSNCDYLVMHTSSPGSPFSVIISDEKISQSDKDETAIFTGCFSRAWREMKKTATIDIFSLSQLYKTEKMKIGTWGVKGEVKRINVSLELALTKQKGKLRAVPEKSAKKNILLKIKPGKLNKKDALPKLQIEISESLNHDELLSALPTGGIAILRK